MNLHRNLDSAGDPISQILKNSRTIAVVGLSSRQHRPSYGVSQYMQSAGYRIIPVNPGETEVLGEKCYARLEDIPEPVDVVDIFRRSEFVPAIVDSAILAQAGNRAVEVKNPLPLDANAWGDTSNKAHILVPFSFTTAWSHNKY